MKLFYNKLIDTFAKQAIKDLYYSAGVVPVQFIDLYAGQDYDPQSFEAFDYPALLINWAIDYRTTPPVVTIDVHLCYEQLRDTSSNGMNRSDALKFFDFTQKTDEILKSIQTEHTGQLHLISEGNKLDETVMNVYNFTYQCSYSGKLPNPKTGYIAGEIENLAVDRQGLYSQLLG